MARLVQNGFELGSTGSGLGNMRFWDADATVYQSGNMYSNDTIVRVNGRSMQIRPVSRPDYVSHYFAAAAPTEVWFRMAFKFSQDGAFYNYYNPLVKLLRPAGSDVTLELHGTSDLFLSLQHGAAILDEETGIGAMLNDTWHLMELHFKADAVAGRVELKFDGSTLLEWDGNTGTAPVLGVDVGCIAENSLMPTGNYYFDDVALNDGTGARNNSWVGDGHIVALRPNGNGTYSELTGSDGNQTDNYQLMDEDPLDEADYVEGLSTGLRDSYQLQSALSAGIPPGATIKHVDAAIVGKTLNVGGDALEGFVRTGGVNYYQTKQNLLGDWVGHQFDFSVNPATLAAWTTAELDGAEAGLRTAAV